MRCLVTGANGFLGRYVVSEALARGHRVHALLRPATDVATLPWADDPNVRIVRADLRRRQGLVEALAEVDTVLHLAAAKAGDLYAQLAGTVLATENLLDAMAEAHIQSFVAISSFSVYDYLGRRSWSLIDEQSPLEPRPERRDAYCRTKMLQEQLIRDRARQHDWPLTVLRPGVIYGPDNTWTARLGMKLNDRLYLRTGAWAKLPLTYVGNCAAAVVLAAERNSTGERVFNVVDDAPPSQRRYLNACRKRLSPKPMVIPVAWTVMRSLARLAWLTNLLLFRGRAKMPGILVPARLHARCKPMLYSNRRIKDALGWQPRTDLATALDLSLGDHQSPAEAPIQDDPSHLAQPT